MIEDVLAYTFKKVLNVDVNIPFNRMPYEQAMSLYGSDKPDVRFDLTFKQLPEALKKVDSPLLNGQSSAYLIVPEALGRKQLDTLTEIYKKHGGHILASLKFDGNDYSGSLNKQFPDELKAQLHLKPNETLLLSVGSEAQVYEPLGAVRNYLGKTLHLIDENQYEFLWVVDFPLFEYDEEEGRYYAKHHPFTAPRNFDDMIHNPRTAKANAYDIVLNGYELGGGSIRIHQEHVQQKMFEMLGMSPDVIKERFGFFTEALTYGTPPHGGIALGLDRLVMLMTHRDNIKDVIAFPKTQSARDVMMEAPSTVDTYQLDDVHLEVKK
jgi:aspartyl-tRNA synthetase